MSIEDLFKKRLVFVTGKGGVGKTALTCAAARALANNEKRVALIELSSEELCSRYMDKKAPFITLFRLEPQQILRDFVEEHFHSKLIYKTFFDNRFVHNFLDATPGFNEFLIMNRIWHIAERELTHFDSVLVDAPATGHALALLEVPQIVAKAVHSGPIREAAAHSLTLITDMNKTGVLTVSVPEEMPATEAIEIKGALAKCGVETIGTLINRVIPKIELSPALKKVPNNISPVVSAALEANEQISKLQSKHISALKKVYGKNILELPQLENRSEREVAAKLSTLLVTK